MTENELSKIVIGLAIHVHQKLGPGLLEKTYLECLFYEIQQAGLFVEKEKPMPLTYGDVGLDCGYRIDLLVENKLVLELKSVAEINNVHLAQTLTYLRIGNFRLGLLINFNICLLKDGIRRLVNNF